MRSVFLYILLVGIPTLAVIGILQLGASLRPPASVGGSWQIQLGTAPAHTIDCTDTLIQTKDPTLTILQSGSHLQLALNDAEQTILQGTIEGLHVTVTGPVSKRSGHIGLQADLDRQAEPDVLRGQFTSIDCASQRAAFTAVRKPAEAR